MPHGMPVDYDDIWNEVSSAEFESAETTTEYDVNTVRELALLLREARNILNHPHTLNQEQVNILIAKVRELKTEVIRQSSLVKNALRK